MPYPPAGRGMAATGNECSVLKTVTEWSAVDPLHSVLRADVGGRLPGTGRSADVRAAKERPGPGLCQLHTRLGEPASHSHVICRDRAQGAGLGGTADGSVVSSGDTTAAFQVSGRSLSDAPERGMTTYREVVMAGIST